MDDRLYVTVLSERSARGAAKISERREGIAGGDFGCMSVQLYELLHFLIPTGAVVLVLAFTDEPKQTWALAISAGMLHRFTSALLGGGV